MSLQQNLKIKIKIFENKWYFRTVFQFPNPIIYEIYLKTNKQIKTNPPSNLQKYSGKKKYWVVWGNQITIYKPQGK